MDYMVAQGTGAIIIIYGSLIVIFLAILSLVVHFWRALVSGDIGFIVWWSAIILGAASLYAGCGLYLRRSGTI